MKATFSLLLILLLPAAASAQAPRGAQMPRTMYVTYDRAPMYDSATYLSTILEALPRGDSVIVTGRSGTFLQVVRGERKGYVLATNLGTAPPKGTSRATGATPSSREERAGSGGSAPSTEATPATATEGTSTEGTSHEGASTGRPSKAAKEQGKPGGDAATVQCKALTKSGKQCSRRTSDPSGYCWQHKK